VVHYIDVQLTLRYKRHRKDYREAIAALDALARKEHGRAFAGLDPGAQTRLLTRFESGPHRGAFNMVLNHAMQGFYGNPRHGGNRDYASWRMMGVPTVPVRGRLHYTLGENS
jgi:gluconate 2-dehydrogenase gamma chain